MKAPGPTRSVLVFGGAGFLGARLCTHLREHGWTPIVVERDETPDVIVRTAPDAVINAAVNYGRAGESLSDMLKVNSLLPLTLAELCVKAGVKRLVQVDTFSWKPRTDAFIDLPYTHTKRLAGELLRYMPRTSLVVMNARLEHMYGPGDRSHKLIPSLLAAFLTGQAEFQMSDGEQQRDFVFIDDVARAVQAMLEAPSDPGFHEVEVGTGRATSLREFVHILKRECGAKTELRFGARSRLPGDMQTSSADTRWLDAHGATPRIMPEEGCRLIVQAARGATRLGV